MSVKGYCIVKPNGEIIRRTETYFEALEEVRDTDLVILFTHEAVGDLDQRLLSIAESLARKAEIAE